MLPALTKRRGIMTRKELKDLGLDETQIDEVMALHGQDINNKKAEVRTEKDRASNLESQLSDLQAQVDELSSTETDLETLKTQLKDEMEKSKKALKDQKALFEDKLLNNAIMAELTKNGCLDNDMAMVKIDKQSLKLNDDGTVDGVDTIVKQIVESSPFIFEKESKTEVELDPQGLNQPADANQIEAQEIYNALHPKRIENTNWR